MPRHPNLSGPAAAMPASIFARLVERLAGYPGEIVPFHIGDTHVEPPPAARLENLDFAGMSTSKLYAYGPPAGDPELIEAVLGKLAAKNGLRASAAGVQITSGATHAFSCAARALLDPGDEVLLLTPCWPLLRGHVIAAGGTPVDVPFSQELLARPGADVRELVAPYIGPRTVGIYFITPNNPDGLVLSAGQLGGLAELAIRHDLWVLADEVYEDYVFDGLVHRSIATLPGMADRTLTFFSFSKSYAMAGLRVGYVVGPEPVIGAIRKLANHSVYNVPRALQRAAHVAMATGEAFLARTRATYQTARDLTLERVGLPTAVPQGGSYVFVDLTAYVPRGETTALPVLERLAAEGILLAPGDAFSSRHATWARLCYTAVPLGRLEAGLERLGKALRK
jgi:aspartate/methionine/tyrosine aminotransferase